MSDLRDPHAPSGMDQGWAVSGPSRRWHWGGAQAWPGWMGGSGVAELCGGA